MRIFTAVRHATDPKFFYGGLWSGNFYPALNQLGHEIVESQVDLLPASRFMDVSGRLTHYEQGIRADITQRIVDEVRTAHRQRPLNLFLSYFYNSHFDPEGFSDIHRLGIPTVNFYCNSIYQFELVEQIAPRVNFAWHAEKHARQAYLRAGANPVWVQMGADPEIYCPAADTPRRAQTCFVGQRYADRDRWMAALIRASVPVEIYGPGWGERPAGAPPTSARGPESKPSRWRTASGYVKVIHKNFGRQGLWGGLVRTCRQERWRRETRRLSPLFAPVARGPLPFTAIQSVFAGNEVILNFSNVWADGWSGSELIPHVRLRDFEAPMCRTCYLTGYTDEIAEFYELGKEIDTYRTPEELVDKARFYLAHPDRAEQLREAGYQRARQDHTWTKRFDQLLRTIGLQ